MFGVLLATLSLAAAAQQDASQVAFATTTLAPGLYMISSGEGGNIGVSVGDDGVLLIDDELTPLTPKLEQTIASLSNTPVRIVLNTHWHFDHTGGNEAMGVKGAVVIASENVRTRLAKGQFVKAFNMAFPPAPHAALPVVTFDKNVTVHWNNDTLEVVHVAPAHTDGDSVVYFKGANVVHMGDLFWNGMYPLIDESSGGSTAGMINAVAAVLARIDKNTRVIPGHGLTGDKAQLRAYHDMLKAVHGRIKKLHDQGKTVEEIMAAKPTADYDAAWGKGLFSGDQWVQIVYSTL